MNPSVIDAGYLHRNGHGRCGMCRAVEDRAPGGRARRKAEGWAYDRVHGLGWLCPACIRHARAETRRRELEAQEHTDHPPPRAPDVAAVRGFGLQPVGGLELPRRRKRHRKRARLAAWRAHYRERGEAPPADLEAHLPAFMPLELEPAR